MKLRRPTRHLVAAISVISALILTGCGDDASSPGEPTASDPASVPQTDQKPSASEPPTTPAADGPTTIPDDFPLTSGWMEDDGSSEYQLAEPSRDNQAMIAAGELQACDQSVSGGDPVDRLTTRLDWGSAAYVREIQLFAGDIEAQAFVDSIEDTYAQCPTDDQDGTPPTFTTEVHQGALGEESLVVTRASDGIGRVVINVVRAGNAVVVDIASDEGTGDTVIDLATETRENLADVIAATYDLQG